MRTSLKTFRTAALVSVVFGALALAAPALAENCDSCHRHDLLKPGGQSLLVHPKVFAGTVHAGLLCSDCHKGAAIFPHEKSMEVRCDLPCHVASASHTKITEEVAAGPHAALGGAGKPGCVTCHDSSKADGLKGAGGEALCASCHPGKAEGAARYPSSPGDFGRRAHDALGADKPGCASCHPAHGSKRGEGAKSCGKSGCHEGSGSQFSVLYSHGDGSVGGLGLPAVGALLAAALSCLLALRSPKGAGK